MKKVLLVLKSKVFGEQHISDICAKSVFSTKLIYSYLLAKEQVKRRKFDVILIFDDNLSNNCVDFLEYLYIDQYPTRVFFLSSCCRFTSNKLSALQFGADDCLSFPCDCKELDLRLKKLIYMQKIHPNGVLKASGIILYPHNGMVENEGIRVPLRKKEFQILFHLFRHKNSVVTREMLSEYIWGEETPNPSTIDSYVRRIRILLAEKSEILETIWGFGYRVIDK